MTVKIAGQKGSPACPITTIEEAGKLAMEWFRLFSAESIDMTPMQASGQQYRGRHGPGLSRTFGPWYPIVKRFSVPKRTDVLYGIPHRLIRVPSCERSMGDETG